MTHRFALTAMAMTVTLLFATAPAHAQFRVFVSDGGNDANNCFTIATACASLSHAQATVLAGGVIHVLPGEYGAVTITKSVDIIADGGQASMTSSAVFISPGVEAPILINAGPTDVVRIRGITTSFPTLASSGVAVISAGQVYVENCTFANGNGAYGLVFRPSGDSKLVVTNSTISNNGGGGIEVRPGAGAFASVVIDNTRLSNNGPGVLIRARSNVTMRKSTISGNTIGLWTSGGSAVLRAADSTVTQNGIGLQTSNGGQLISHRGNMVADNTTDGAFTATVNQQ
jgi:Right handed beta helix region